MRATGAIGICVTYTQQDALNYVHRHRTCEESIRFLSRPATATRPHNTRRLHIIITAIRINDKKKPKNVRSAQYIYHGSDIVERRRTETYGIYNIIYYML
jgi:hypothetical protein